MRNRGFTLVEVIASLAIVGMAMLSVLMLFAMNEKTKRFKEEQLIATTLMQRKIEEIKCKSFATDVTAGASAYSGFEGYFFTVAQEKPWNGNLYLKRIRVHETWIDSFGKTKQYQIYFLVANY